MLWSSSETERNAGVWLIVGHLWDKHILNTFTMKGRILMATFAFKGKKRLKIIQVYLPHDKTGNSKFHKTLNEIIDKSVEENIDLIVMGNFNAVINPREDCFPSHASNQPETIFLSRLKKDLFDAFETNRDRGGVDRMTFHKLNASSKIDLIWTFGSIKNCQVNFENSCIQHYKETDYNLIAISFKDSKLRWMRQLE